MSKDNQPGFTRASKIHSGRRTLQIGKFVAKVRIGLLAAAALFALPCARPTCCDRDSPCSGKATCLLTVDERVCSKGMCATEEEVADYLRENAP